MTCVPMASLTPSEPGHRDHPRSTIRVQPSESGQAPCLSPHCISEAFRMLGGRQLHESIVPAILTHRPQHLHQIGSNLLSQGGDTELESRSTPLIQGVEPGIS